ncbi:NUDIX hydrolase [Candidatus Micrarchaeota archaeon]|nr:NUDIX hydrolase [Candidatus Micrarchaeota archaeon]
MRPISTDGIILKDGRILLIKRKNEPFKGMWALPGGLIEDNETLGECVKREIMEETGLAVEAERLTGIYSKPDRDPRKVITVVFICRITGGNEKAGDDAKELKWFSLGKLPVLAADHKKVITDAVKIQG